MSKFSTVALSIAGAATVVVIGVAASATAATLPMITGSSSSSSTSTSTSSSAPTETTTPPSETPSADTITADITVTVGDLGVDRPTVFKVTGVTVGNGPELTQANTFENTREQCRDVSVDVSLDPTTITVTGGEGTCSFGEVYVEVTLHGVVFTSTTVLSDNLFAQFGSPSVALGLDGGSYKARGVHFAATDAFPVLDSFGVTGNTFSAHWSGASASAMNGAAVFQWVPVAQAAAAAAAAPAFTG